MGPDSARLQHDETATDLLDLEYSRSQEARACGAGKISPIAAWAILRLHLRHRFCLRTATLGDDRSLGSDTLFFKLSPMKTI